MPIAALRAGAPHGAAGRGRRGHRPADFGSLVHQVLEWVPLDASATAEGVQRMAAALAPVFGLDDEAAGAPPSAASSARSCCP